MGTLKKNFAYQTLYQILNILLPLISTPYIARVLGAENTGVYSYANNMASYFVIFGMLGIEQYGTRSIANVRDNEDELSVVFSELFVFHSFVSIVVIFIYFGYVFFLGNEYFQIFLIQGMHVISVLFDLNWFFFGIEKFKVTVIRSAIIKILSFLAIFVFVRDRGDLNIYTFIMAFSILISQLALLPVAKKYVKFRKVSFAALKKHVKPMLMLFVAVIAVNLNRMIDKVMLGWFGLMEELGYYDYADHIIRTPLSLIAAFGTVMLSKMSNLFSQNKDKEMSDILDTSACLILMLSFAMSFGVVAISPEFVSWYLGVGYTETNYLIHILALSIPLVGWNNFVRTQILIPRKLDSIYTKAVIIGAMVNIIGNCYLINLMGARGSAIATVISYFVISIIQTISLLDKSDIKTYLQYALYPCLIGVIMYFTIRISAKLVDNIFISLMIEFFVGIIVYCSFMLLYLRIRKPTILKKLLKK